MYCIIIAFLRLVYAYYYIVYNKYVCILYISYMYIYICIYYVFSVFCMFNVICVSRMYLVGTTTTRLSKTLCNSFNTVNTIR